MTLRRKKPKTVSELPVESRILGNDTFAAITAVEGLALGSASRARLMSMRERRLSHGEQRDEIIRAYLESK
jgi:hypothetical protein